MGWTVHYRAVLPGALDEDSQRSLRQSMERWNPELSGGCEGYFWEEIPHDERVHAPLTWGLPGASYSSDAVPTMTAVEREFGVFDVEGNFTRGEHDRSKTYLRGFTKIAFSEDPRADFCTILSALKQLAADHPTWVIRATDDFDLVSNTDVRELGDPRDLLEED